MCPFSKIMIMVIRVVFCWSEKNRCFLFHWLLANHYFCFLWVLFSLLLCFKAEAQVFRGLFWYSYLKLHVSLEHCFSCVPQILCSFPFWLTHTVVRCVNFQTFGFFQTSLCCRYLMSLEFGIIQVCSFRIHHDLWVEDIICPGEWSMSSWKCWWDVL